MSQLSLNKLNIFALIYQERGIGVTKIVETYFGKSCSLQSRDKVAVAKIAAI